MIIFGNITTSYWKGLDRLRADNPNRELFIVKVCNTAPGQKWDYDFHTSQPGWDIINQWNKDHDKLRYTEKYNRILNSRYDAILYELDLILLKAKGKTVVFVCHEEYGFCHRQVLIEWLWKNGLINGILNSDVIQCYACWDCYDAIERENEWNSVMGYTTMPCAECQDDDGTNAFRKDC